MSTGAISVLELSGSARERGLAHGEQCAEQIREYAAERVGLVGGGVWNGLALGRERVLELAEACVPAHDSYSPELTEELRALAHASGITVGEALIASGFTDFVDTVYGELGRSSAAEDDCTAFLVPDELAAGAGFLAQTWDMHDSAVDYVVLLDVKPNEGPRALILSTTGCLGQIGMNELGICVGINNLMGADGGVGVTWPHVVRKALLATDLDEALACILDASLAGAHNYLLFDGEGRGYNVEAFTSRHRVSELGSAALIHTNHALFDETVAVSQERPPDLQASSLRRLEHARGQLSRERLDFESVAEILRQPTLCYPAAPPLALATCGAVVMRPRMGELWACQGPPDANEFERHVLRANAASAS